MIIDAGYDRLFVVRLSEQEYKWLIKQRIDVDDRPGDTFGRLLYAVLEPKGKHKKKVKL